MSAHQNDASDTTFEVRPELHTRIPVIRLWGVLLVPLQGDISDAQVSELVATVLEEIRRGVGTGVVIDLSGLQIVDSHLCATFTNLAASARYMGATTVLCGLSADIAMTLQSMGIELEGVRTTLTLEQALGSLGIRPRATASGKKSRAARGKLADQMLSRNPASADDLVDAGEQT